MRSKLWKKLLGYSVVIELEATKIFHKLPSTLISGQVSCSAASTMQKKFITVALPVTAGVSLLRSILMLLPIFPAK